MFNLLDKLLVEEFKDTFAPASEEEVKRRNKFETKRLTAEAYAWLAQHPSEEWAEAAKEVRDVVLARKRVRRRLNKLIKEAPKVVRSWLKITKNTPWLGTYSLPDSKLIFVLEMLRDFDTTSIEGVAQRVARTGR